MTRELGKERLQKLDELLKGPREPRYRYMRGMFPGSTYGWRKVEAKTGLIVAYRCGGCDTGCKSYFDVPPSLASDD